MTQPPSLGKRFEIGQRIAASAMSEVWLARDHESGMRVAVKWPAARLDPALDDGLALSRVVEILLQGEESVAAVS